MERREGTRKRGADSLAAGSGSDDDAAPRRDGDPHRYEGTVKSYVDSDGKQGGYGFIDCAQARGRYGRDVFLHRAQAEQAGGVEKGDTVSFLIILNPRQQPQARHLKIMQRIHPGEHNRTNYPQKAKHRRVSDTSTQSSAASYMGGGGILSPGIGLPFMGGMGLGGIGMGGMGTGGLTGFGMPPLGGLLGGGDGDAAGQAQQQLLLAALAPPPPSVAGAAALPAGAGAAAQAGGAAPDWTQIIGLTDALLSCQQHEQQQQLLQQEQQRQQEQQDSAQTLQALLQRAQGNPLLQQLQGNPLAALLSQQLP